MKVRILRPALEDIAIGRKFYDSSALGLGSYFFRCVFLEINSLERFAGIHRQQLGFHRLLVKKFPYGIYYRVLESEAVVFRVLDCRRDPKWIRSALRL